MARKKSVEPGSGSDSNGAGAAAPAGTKSQAIRDAYARLGNKTRPRDIIAELAKQGVVVSSAQVSMVSKAMGIKKRRRRRGAEGAEGMGAAPAVKGGGESVSVSHLIAAKNLADQMGGIKVVRKALETLERLR
jgi:hypothetical protein